MPLVVGLLILVATVYQLFFRFEHWPNPEKDGAVYEHDNLTGETHLIKPGAHVSLVARIFGSGGERIEEAKQDWQEGSSRRIEIVDERVASQDTADTAQVIPVPKEVVVATTAAPVPIAMLATADENRSAARPFAIRKMDLDRDGTQEEIIQNALQSDGLLDISIVKNGQEIFYGRGKRISLLPTRHDGWQDIALATAKGREEVYQYHSGGAAYAPKP